MRFTVLFFLSTGYGYFNQEKGYSYPFLGVLYEPFMDKTENEPYKEPKSRTNATRNRASTRARYARLFEEK